jgi:hypothetical protein
MSPRDKLGQLRALRGENGFAMEPLPGGTRFPLIWLEIGHAVWNGPRGAPAFDLEQAIRYLRQFKAED